MIYLSLTIFVSLLSFNNAFVCEGDGFFADPSDCAKFYRCHAGRVFEFSCGPGTHFNPTHNGCDWPSAVGCQPSPPESQPSRYQNPYQQFNERRQQPHQSHRYPEESQQVDTRHDGSAHQNPNQNTYRQQNNDYDRGEQPYEESVGNFESDFRNQENNRPVERQREDRNKPQTRQKQTPERKKTDNTFTDEDSSDHSFDERIPERRPEGQRERRPEGRQTNRQKSRPKPTQTEENDENPDEERTGSDRSSGNDRVRDRRPEDRKRTGYDRRQELDETEDEWAKTTRRQRVPKRRFRTTTTVSTTESDSDEEDDDFLELFEKGLKKESEITTEAHDWLQFDEIDSQDIETTTEDQYVSMLKSRVPVRRNRTDRNRKLGSKQTTVRSTPLRSRARTTTTLDPFRDDWNAFNSGKKNGHQSGEEDNRQKANDLNFKRKPIKEDPLLIPDLISYLNCTEAGKDCNRCEDLDWIKYSGIGLQALPFRSFKFHAKILTKQCYKACSDSQQCIAFSYSETLGVCHIYDELSVEDIQSNKDFNTVIQNPISDVLHEEWLYTKNGHISGQEIDSLRTDDAIECLRTCVKDIENCKAINYGLSDRLCKIYDENEGFSVNRLKANSLTLQHLSLFDDKNQWRFEDMGHKNLENNEPIDTIPVVNVDECFYECLENNNNCSYITIGKNSQTEDENQEMSCHLFAFTSTPRWTPSEDNSNQSYALRVPKNHSRIEEFSGYSYVGNPVEVLKDMTEDECREYAEEKCEYCRKYTAIIETEECALFSDSALLSPSLSEQNYTEKSALISIPKESEYLAFKRIPWKMFVTETNPYELKGEINGQKCVQFCLQQKKCVATALVYDTIDSSLFCYFFKESDLQNANTTEYENVDLFIKIQEQNRIPGFVGNRSEDCSDGEPLDDAVKNVNDLDADMDVLDRNSNDNFHKSDTNPLSPHGYDYYGGPQEENPSRQSRIRNVRDLSQQKTTDSKPTVAESLNSTENALSLLNSVKQNAKKKQILDKIPTIASELRKAAKNKRLDTKTTKSVEKLSKDCVNVNDFDFSSNSNDNNDEICKETIDDNPESEICREIPTIIYSDVKQMNSCKNSSVESECDVICRNGYEPNVDKVKCDKIGNRNVWKTKNIKCLPIETQCEEVRDDRNIIRLKASSKYPNEKLHYVLRFDKRKKLPQFSVYIHTRDNNNNKTEPQNRLTQKSCQLINENQLPISDYKKNFDYNLKTLLPEKAFLYSKSAQNMNQYLANTAPQDVFTSRGPWNTLENRTLEMLKTRPGIVISGVCPETILDEVRNRDKTIEIPTCFWQIVCVPYESGVTSVAFYGENTHPISQLEKQTRVEQIKQYRDQKFIIRLLGTDLFRNVWVETFNAFKESTKGIDDFIKKCAQTQVNSGEAICFWDNVINGEESGEKWQSKFSYGLEKNDELNKNQSKTQNKRNRSQISSKRSTDQSLNHENYLSDESNDALRDRKHTECDNKIIGYITSWGNKSFTVDEGKLLSHVIFAYINMDSDGHLGPFNKEIHTNKVMFSKLYEMLSVKTKLLNEDKELKTMVSIGGWNHSEHFPSIVSSAEYSKNFISDTLNIIDYWNLDGIEIDWKYPVIGGAKPGQPSDRENFVLFLKQIKQAFNAYEKGKGRTDPLILSITGASGYWMIKECYDLEGITPLVDWINVLTYDYFGPWKSKYGASTGPNAPLYPSAPIDSMSKMNIHSTLEGYFCELNATDKLIMSIPFYGHYWNNVGDPIDTKDNHFRDAHPVGGFVTYNNIKTKWLLNTEFKHFMHEKSLTPYLWSEYKRVLLSYENRKSIENKIWYALDHSLGGVSVWAVDFDDDESELLNTIVDSFKKCVSYDIQTDHKFKCNKMEKKWWSTEDGMNAGLCGRSGPLINGLYPICDPDNQSMHCCSSYGRCGSGPQFCECEGCIDYVKNPEEMTREPIKPSTEVRWMTSDKQPNGNENEGQPICGYKAQLMNNSYPICNPDDDNAHCCSADGLCGIGSQFCECEQCVNFRNNPKFEFHKKLWWDQIDGLHNAGRCGRLAPKIEDSFPICNPHSSEAYCCGKWGFCGSGPLSCDCVSCVNFKKNPFFRWK